MHDIATSTPGKSPPALQVRDVSFTYAPTRRHGPVRALSSIDLAVHRGQSVAMLGPNGSGKSTLMRTVAGLQEPNSGDVAVFGATQMLEKRRAIGVVFQSMSLDRHLTVHENLRDQATLYGINGRAADERIADELSRAGLTDRRDSYVKTLSGGMARRVDLCRALLHHPRLLLLDEPTVGLDPAARETFLVQLEERRRDHDLTIIMSTHLVDEADRHDRVVLLHGGRLIADDSPVNLRLQVGARRITVIDGAWTPPGEEVADWQRVSTGWSMALGDDAAQTAEIAARLARTGVSYSVAPPTLADVFEQLTGRSLEDDEAANVEAPLTKNAGQEQMS